MHLLSIHKWIVTSVARTWNTPVAGGVLSLHIQLRPRRLVLIAAPHNTRSV